MTRQSNEPVALSLLFLVGFSVVVALMASELLGPSSPLRSHLSSTGAPTGIANMWALILTVGLLVAVAAGIVAWSVLQGQKHRS